MNAKKRALKALLILLGVLALSMFFARTVQTITTAKVQRIQATRGKLEDEIEVKGEIYFSQAEPFTVDDARKLNITVDKLLAKPGYLIKQGDALFTAAVPGFEEEVGKIKENYDKKVRELTVEVAGHLRLPQQSEHNRYYNQMLRTTDDYYDRLYEARAAAIMAGHTLPEDVAAWGPDTAATAAPSPSVTPEEARKAALTAKVKDAMNKAYEAKMAMDEATATLKKIYQGTGPVARTGDGTYDYIKKTDGMREEIENYSRQMLELSSMKTGLQTITAPRDGWLMTLDVKAGDKYDGSKAAYSLSLPGETPVLRCDITDVIKPLQQGMKARLEGSQMELTISEISTGSDNKKYAVIALDEAAILDLGGLSKLMSGQQNLTITYKAQRTTALIPASALRTAGKDEYYVYVIQQGWGGMLSNTTFTAKKQPVKVIETSQKLVSLEDDLSYVEIADQEDRPLSDGQAVMDYVD